MSRLVMVLSICSIFIASHAQGDFRVEYNRDTVYLGNTVTISFVAENIDGEFESPHNFEELPVVFGPNTSRSMSIVNGVAESKSTYSYTLNPAEPGILVIEPAYIITQDSTHETEFLNIVVLENPEGIIQKDKRTTDFGSFFNFGPSKSKPRHKKKQESKSKRKIKRI